MREQTRSYTTAQPRMTLAHLKAIRQRFSEGAKALQLATRAGEMRFTRMAVATRQPSAAGYYRSEPPAHGRAMACGTDTYVLIAITVRQYCLSVSVI
nr:hypothetical protein [Erwinia amylovora]